MTLSITTAATTPKPDGLEFLDEYGAHIAKLYETGSRPLTAVAGTANAVTATMAVDLTAAGYVDGLCVSLTWVAANTAGVTLAINGGAPVAVLDAKGDALTAAVLEIGLTSILRYTAGNWRIVSSIAGASALGPTYEAFTASGTWTKPVGYDDDAVVMVELWGGGGAGAQRQAGLGGGGGGGGGAYAVGFYRIADLASSITVTIGAGGAVAAFQASGNAGGNTTFGSLLTAFGGGGGQGNGTTNAANAGGGGGGELGPGATSAAAGTITIALGGIIGGGDSNGTAVAHAKTMHAGGGGGISTAWAGGSAAYGGAGGGGCGITAVVGSAGGTSKYGGNGGQGSGISPGGVAGSVPGGGGGGSGQSWPAGAGARGECRIRIFG